MKITTILRSNLAIHDSQGEIIRNRIIKKLSRDKRATVDCGGIVCMTTHFIYPISDLVLIYPIEALRKNVRFTNVKKSDAELIKRCITNTIKKNEEKIS